MGIIYLDNAATSWPKPPAVAEAMSECMHHYAANPGRGSHQMAVKAGRILFETRRNIAKLIGARNPNDIIFTGSTTMGLNLAIQGFLKPGDHVITTSFEHNSVRRPLEYMRKNKGIELTYLPSDANGNINLAALHSSFRNNTTLVVVAHGSNLLGTILPLGEIGNIVKDHGAKLLVDAAQTLGTIPVDVNTMNIDMLAFPGHKGLLGPQGTGGLYIHPAIDLEPLLYGGTGSQSELIEQPSVRPDRYEAGTLNTPGIAGLNEGVKFVLKQTAAEIHRKEWALIQRLINGLEGMDRIHLLGPDTGMERTGLLSFYFEHIDSSELAFILDHNYQIAVRSGFHCAPLAHETAGTLSTGAVRASVGWFTTEEEVDALITALHEVVKHY